MNRELTDGEDARLVRPVALGPPGVVHDDRLVRLDPMPAGSLSKTRMRPRAAQRRVEVSRQRRVRTRADVPIHHLAVEAPHPDEPWMAGEARRMLELRGELDVGHALSDDLARAPVDGVSLPCRLLQLGKLPTGLDHAYASDEITRVDGLGPGEGPAETLVERHRQDVELEAEPSRKRVSVFVELAWNGAHASQRHDLLQS